MAPPNGQVRNLEAIPNSFPSFIPYILSHQILAVGVPNELLNSPFSSSALASGRLKTLNNQHGLLCMPVEVSEPSG